MHCDCMTRSCGVYQEKFPGKMRSRGGMGYVMVRRGEWRQEEYAQRPEQQGPWGWDIINQEWEPGDVKLTWKTRSD